jgi:ribonucleoside-diphosphate reductase alpha chain
MNKYERMSLERKEGIAKGEIPPWFTGGGYQLFKEKYQWAETPYQQYSAIARAAAKHVEHIWEDAYSEFFNLLWNGWLSPSTPILANMGTYRGLPVSCSGGYISDSIDGFYTARRETAILTKYGFGTSGYLGDIRGRGSNISIGGRASGVLPVFKGFVRDMQEVAQGTQRRGAWAGYLPIDHNDFDELADLLHHKPDDLNVGWVVDDKFINGLQEGKEENLRRYQKALKVKMITGKGYFFFVDKANRHRPDSYVENDLDIKASNLCTEIMLYSSEDYTFTCVLSSMNLAKWHEWKDTNAVYWATIFLDCVAQEFIEKAKDTPGLEKAVAFTEKGRALGLGVCGWHTLLQMKKIPFESLDAQFLNTEIFSHIEENSFTASWDMGDSLGVPEWCQEHSRLRNTHRIAIAPTKSTALIMGGVSEGINPDPAMTYTQITAAGEVERINPVLLDLMKEKGVYSEDKIQEVVDAFGSVQGVDWLTNAEKLVFRTAFEIDQRVVLRLASQRQKYVDQGQSLNLFFSEETPEEEISAVHKEAFLNENILSLYYCYSKAGVSASKGDCISCQ